MNELAAFLDSQFLKALVPLLTLLILVVYAWDTRRIAKSSLAQARAQHRPVLVLDASSRRYDIAAGWEQVREGRVLRGEIEGDLQLSNIGPGPAFEVWIVTEEHPGFRFFEPHLDAGKSLPVGISSLWFSQKPEGTETRIRIRYRGVGGRFESRYAVLAKRRTASAGNPGSIEVSYLAVSELSVVDLDSKFWTRFSR